MNPIMLLLDFFNVLKDCAVILYNFLFEEYTIIGITFRPFAIIGIGGGVGLVAFIIAKLVKDFIPVA